MKSELTQILEKYKAKGGDEQRFMDKHTDNISVFDGPGVEEISKAVDGVKAHNRFENNHGYESGQDEEVYEDLQYADADPTFFMQIIEEAISEIYEESSDEEKQLMDEMFSTEEGYEEFITMILEADEDDDDEDDDEDDEDDEIIEKKPKIKSMREKYKKN